MKIKDPVSAITHFAWLILAIPSAVVLIVMAALRNNILNVVSFSVFGISLIALYGASSIYHTFITTDAKNKLLKRIDHMMIFVLIAGSYTPICIGPLRGVWGFSLLIAIWIIAILGILLKIFWLDAPRWLSTSIYVFMGWLVVFAFYPLYNAMPFSSIMMLILGGLSYTIGAVIYAIKMPKIEFEFFGFHEVFHIFVMIGTVFHVILMFQIVTM